ncbi:ubiquinone biosynthesis protein COQ4 homolog, mitochondrial [Cyclospora cayetanensis]|uniref:Ubiquinone biosynthesis protein COQ4 homolog, mitochondrial n=1 Tax=Cyclospora cayetanensis TaxID=88456 RepID=A0A6P6RVX1_9EIME|nr:ubiquinone biosynthesis protein COQ4 homolog, mitochondrial [Cyclospora cayetanensis]
MALVQFYRPLQRRGLRATAPSEPDPFGGPPRPSERAPPRAIGAASGASESPLLALAAVGGVAAAAAAAVRRRVSKTSLWQTLFKADIAARCAINAVLRPKEDLHIATLSEMFVESQLERMRQFMMCEGQEEEGREILKQRPLFDDRFIDYEGLRRLPENTLGYALMKFLDGNSLHAGHRQPVRFVEDEELAYILTRYRQLHDVMHAAFGMGISVESEVALKLIEFHQTGLPMTLLSAAFGPFAAPLLRVQLSAAATDVALAGGGPAAVASVTHSLTEAPNSWLQLLTSQKEKHPAASATPAATPAKTEEEQGPVVLYPRQVLLNDLLPWADAAGKAMRRRVYCLFVEEWLDKPLDAFREHCCIMLPPAHLLPYCA